MANGPNSGDPRRRPYHILLGVSGSVAALKLKQLITELSQLHVELRIVSTDAARHFFEAGWDLENRIYGDKDDWHSWTKVGDEVLHIQLRRWADILLIAPLSANTLAKLAHGVCDNLLTSIVRAWDRKAGKAILLAPAMNTSMWDNPLTAEAMEKVCNVYHADFIPPVEKTLACGDIGNGAMAHVEDIVQCVQKHLKTLQLSGTQADSRQVQPA